MPTEVEQEIIDILKKIERGDAVPQELFLRLDELFRQKFPDQFTP